MTRRFAVIERRRDAGFTLIEVLASMAIFSTALLGLNLLMVSTLHSNGLARDLAMSRFLAAHRMEQILSSRYMDGNRDAYLDSNAPCTDIDEISLGNFPLENYGEVDLLNGTTFTYRSCAAKPDIKQAAVMRQASDYPSDAQGRNDLEVNRGQYSRFRREVYIVDSANYTNSIVNVALDGPVANTLDNVLVTTTSPSPQNPATNYVKYVLVRVKWKDERGRVHATTLTSEKSYLIPAS